MFLSKKLLRPVEAPVTFLALDTVNSTYWGSDVVAVTEDKIFYVTYAPTGSSYHLLNVVNDWKKNTRSTETLIDNAVALFPRTIIPNFELSSDGNIYFTTSKSTTSGNPAVYTVNNATIKIDPASSTCTVMNTGTYKLSSGILSDYTSARLGNGQYLTVYAVRTSVSVSTINKYYHIGTSGSNLSNKTLTTSLSMMPPVNAVTRLDGGVTFSWVTVPNSGVKMNNVSSTGTLSEGSVLSITNTQQPYGFVVDNDIWYGVLGDNICKGTVSSLSKQTALPAIEEAHRYLAIGASDSVVTVLAQYSNDLSKIGLLFYDTDLNFLSSTIVEVPEEYQDINLTGFLHTCKGIVRKGRYAYAVTRGSKLIIVDSTKWRLYK